MTAARLCRTAACRRPPVPESPYCAACRDRLCEAAFAAAGGSPMASQIAQAVERLGSWRDPENIAASVAYTDEVEAR